MQRFNPFRPNAPIHPGMFVGRLPLVERIEDRLLQGRSGNSSGFLLTGERGIGKSSLLLYTKEIAEGNLKINEEQVRFLVVHTDIDKYTTQIGLVRKIEMGLRNGLGQSEKALGFLKKAWDFLQGVNAGGVSFQKKEQPMPIEALIEESAYYLAKTIGDITSKRTTDEFGLSAPFDGMLLIIDEADNAAPELELGSFLKLLTERLQRQGCTRFVVGLAGLPRVREVLRKSHESSLRLFEELDVSTLSKGETDRVINSGLKEAAEKNGRATTITESARHLLNMYAEGFPHFIQQLCYSAFDKDKDWNIDDADVYDSMFGKGGAIDLIGDKYYRNAFYTKIKQESYRQVLRIMAGPTTTADSEGWISKDVIRKEFKGKPTTLDNALHALSKQNIILRKEGALGKYKLVHRGFAIWILFYTTPPKDLTKMLEQGKSGSENAPSAHSTQSGASSTP